MTEKLNRKCEEIIEQHVNIELSNRKDHTMSLCYALAISARNTKHWHESINLIKSVNPAIAEQIVKHFNL